jgi:hypothetical protein
MRNGNGRIFVRGQPCYDHPGTRACERMIILRALIATLLCWPLRAGAQSIEWKAIACTAENPEVVRGNAVTIYFTDSGQVHFEGTQYPAAVNSAEIRFCFTYVTGRQGCYMISRISGRFTITMTGSGKINGSCTPEGQKPKF